MGRRPWVDDFHPFVRQGVGCVISLFSTLGEFVGNGGRDPYGVEQVGKPRERIDSIKIEERRSVTDRAGHDDFFRVPATRFPVERPDTFPRPAKIRFLRSRPVPPPDPRRDGQVHEALRPPTSAAPCRTRCHPFFRRAISFPAHRRRSDVWSSLNLLNDSRYSEIHQKDSWEAFSPNPFRISSAEGKSGQAPINSRTDGAIHRLSSPRSAARSIRRSTCCVPWGPPHLGLDFGMEIDGDLAHGTVPPYGCGMIDIGGSISGFSPSVNTVGSYHRFVPSVGTAVTRWRRCPDQQVECRYGEWIEKPADNSPRKSG